jgi:yersiniabactin nonribosomal peptide synthetase
MMNKDVIINWVYRRLDQWSSMQPEKTAFTEIFSDGSRRKLSYSGLKKEVDNYSSQLAGMGVGYDTKCMLMFSQVIEFMTAFLACSRIGAVGIPIVIPESGKDISFWKKVIADSECGYILTDKDSENRVKSLFPEMNVIVRSDEPSGISADEKANELLFLQYTSGSTGTPKGVMISHENMKANIEAFCPRYRYNRDSIIVSWLPYYHDLGFIQMLVANIYCGSEAAVMMPTVFIADPVKWLEAISEIHATATCAPNFAFDLTAKAVASYKGNLDLSSLEATVSGGEPIQMNSILRFYKSVEKYGFPDNSLLFGYGQAEATLVVSVCGCGDKNRWLKADREKFQEGKLEILDKGVFSGTDDYYPTDDDSVIYLLANGPAVPDHQVTIREPAGETCLPEYAIGEICFSGASLAMGYYHNQEKTDEIYKIDSSGKMFLRTGDMGFLDEYGFLYITGRIKDLIIINGENFYPQDLEATVSELDESFCENGAIAFSYQDGKSENLVIVQEIKNGFTINNCHYSELLCRIRSEVFKVFGIAPETVAFVPENTLPRTASGKLRRSALRESYVKNGLKGVGQLIAYTENGLGASSGGEAVDDIRSSISRMMLIPMDMIDDSAVFEQLGVSSVIALKLCLDLKEKYPALEVKDIFEKNTVTNLAAYLSGLEKAEPGRDEADDTADLPEKFAMSSIQQAYHAGSNPELAWGGVDCYYACEFDSQELDIDRFRSALEKLMKHQPMLRCVKTADDQQRICDTLDAPLRVYEKVSPENEYNHILKIRQELEERTFGIGEPLFDVRAAEMNEGGFRIFLGISLFICDAYSILIFLEQLRAIYDGAEPEPLKTDYRRYIMREEAEKNSEKYQRDKAYWLSRIDTLPGIPKLPMNIIKEGSSRGRFGRRARLIPGEIWSKFTEKAKQHNVTASMALLGIYLEVLKEYGAGTSFGVMATVMAREEAEEQVIGEYTRLALLTASKREGTFFERVLKLQRQVQEDISHLLYTPMELTKEMRSRGKDSFYPVVFTSVLDNDNTSVMERLNWSFSETPQVFLDFQAISCGEGVLFSFDAIEDLFYENTLTEMFESLLLLTKAAAEEQGFYEKEQFDVRTGSQKTIQKNVNRTARQWDRPMSLISFMRGWQEYADKTAVVSAGESYTYRQLVSRSVDYCNMLRRQTGWKTGERVLIKLPKSFEQIAAIVGVLLAGGCYVPVLKDLGETRVQNILERAKCRFRIDSPLSESAPDDLRYILPDDTDDDIAYIIFTSGSTGEPKGVPITHSQAMNTIYAVNERFGIGSDDKFIGVSSVSFDLSVYDIFGCFNVFGTLVVPAEDERIDPEKLCTLIRDNQVTVYNSVPAIMEVLTEAMGQRSEQSLEKILLSGDWIPLSLPEKIAVTFPNAKVYSLGGATEASIWSNYYPVTKVQENWNSIPYGYPLENQKFFILDKHLKPVPMGVKGRLFIAGDGIANGYFNDAKRSGEAFITLSDGTKAYDTGDYGRYMEDGCIEFLGRKDDQVKINGYRVELGEIEKAFASAGVTERVTVISVGEKMEDKHLAAFIETESEPDIDSLKRTLAEYIPSYCIPQSIIAVYPLPLTANGKSDKKKLTSIYKNRSVSKPAEKSITSNSAGKRLTAIAAEVFGYPGMTADTSLYEIGAASIDMIRLANRLDLEFGSRPTIQELMNCRTLAEILPFYGDAPESADEPVQAADNTLSEYIAGLEVITDASERERIIKQDIAYRYDLSGCDSIPIEESELDGMLTGLFERKARDRKCFAYPSVENVYSVQLYVELPGRGTFYADTRNRRLIRTSSQTSADCMTLYTAAAMDSAYPVYGQDTLKNVFAESGVMLGRVNTGKGTELRVESCENDESLRKQLLLGKRHMLLNKAKIMPENLPPETTSAEETVKAFEEKGVHLFEDGGKLKFRAREGAMTEDMKAQLRAEKEDILYYLCHRYDALPDRYRPFGLTPIQQAYIVGRKPGYEIGGVNAHYYIEFETDRLDVKQFENALNSLIRIHDMLKTVVYEDGTQRVLENVPHYSIEFHENADVQDRMALRSRMRQKKYSLGTWPLFTIAVTRSDAEKDTVHFSLDCILMDAFSAQKTIDDLFCIYNGESVDEPTFTFREYLQQEADYAEKSGIRERSEKFWDQHISCIPGAPDIPYAKELASIQDPVFERKKHMFTEEETAIFSRKAKSYHLTENAVSSYCFMDALSEMCGQERLALNLTMYNRYPLCKEADSILGDFTSTSLLPYEKKASVLDSIKAVGECMMQSVENSGCAGIDLVKRLKENGGSRVMPVVMTSMLHDSQLTGYREVYSVSCTPQVVLDGQAYYRGRNMILGFDYVPEAFADGWTDKFLDRYISKVKELIAAEDWKLI